MARPDSFTRLARAVIAQAARDAVGCRQASRPAPEERRDAVLFFLRAAAGGCEKVWFDIVGLRPKLLAEEVVERWRCA